MNRRRRSKGFAAQGSTSIPSLPINELLKQAMQLLRMRRWAHAEDLCKQVLAVQPQHADALHLMGLIYRDIGDRAQARLWLEQSVAADPQFLAARSNLATVLREMELWSEAQSQFEQALQIDPDHVLSLYNLGVLLQQQHDLQGAMACYQRVVQLQPQMADAHNNLGTVLRALGRTQAAVECYRQGLAIREDPKTLTNLANALRKLGDLQAAREAYELALSWDPSFVLAYNNLGHTLHDLGLIEEAIERYRQALQLRPQYVNALIHLGSALAKAQEWDLAQEHLQRALHYQPESVNALMTLADLHLMQGEVQETLRLCQQCLALQPGNGFALALQGVAYAEAGDLDAARDLMRYETLIQIRQPPPPPGYESLESFHIDVTRAIQNHPSLMWERPHQTTRAGLQTSNLVEETMEPFQVLRDLILNQAQQTVQSLTHDPIHPFLQDLPQALQLLDLWAVVIRTGGYQAPHIHPSAWMSGVYYLAIPESVSPEDPENKGWIEFGPAPDRFACQSTMETVKICPEPGAMILFPSYLYHRTIPLEGTAERISVAFDLIKANSPLPSTVGE